MVFYNSFFNDKDSLFDYLHLKLASPKRIQSWAERRLPNGSVVGEVTVADTLHYRTQEPIFGGILCQRIFGPIENYSCECGLLQGPDWEIQKIITCLKCEVDCIKSTVRRHRSGFIALNYPAAHTWYVWHTPSKIAQVLKMRASEIRGIISFRDYVVLKETSGDFPLKYKRVLHENHVLYPLKEKSYYVALACLTKDERRKLQEYFGLTGKDRARVEFSEDELVFGIGAEAIKTLLEAINVKVEMLRIHDEIMEALSKRQENNSQGPSTKVAALTKKLRLLKAFRFSGNQLSWMILDNIPVLPPDLRPFFSIRGISISSDFNYSYKRILLSNNRLSTFKRFNGPQFLRESEQYVIQMSVDVIINNGRSGHVELRLNTDQPLKSLTDIINGKEGRFRQNLLGKRVDYSGRSVIVVGPELRVGQCGLPREMAIILFQPFIIHKLKRLGYVSNYEEGIDFVQDRENKLLLYQLVEEIAPQHPVLLNRAPTLHRLSIQSFMPRLVHGSAIKLHPLVCPGFNADFDGDQMAVHIPISHEAQLEAMLLLSSLENFFGPSYGEPMNIPTQDAVFGCYYLTTVNPSVQMEVDQYFYSFSGALDACRHRAIHSQTLVWVRITMSPELLDQYLVNPVVINRVDDSVFDWSDGEFLYVTPEIQVKKDRRGNVVSIYLRTTPGRIMFNKALSSN